MTRSEYPYTRKFILNYAVYAAAVAIVIHILINVVGLSFDGAILRGAMIGGAIGGMMVPFQYFARAFLDNENRPAKGGEAWKFAFVWAALAMLVHAVVATALFAIGWQIPGILPQEQGQLVGVFIAVILFLEVPIFRLFIWAAFRGIEAQRRRAAGG